MVDTKSVSVNHVDHKKKLCEILHKFSCGNNDNVMFYIDIGKRIKVDDDSNWNFTNIKMTEWFMNYVRVCLNRPVVMMHTCDNGEKFFELHEYLSSTEIRFYPDLISDIKIKENDSDNVKCYKLIFTQDYGNGTSVDFNIRIHEEYE